MIEYGLSNEDYHSGLGVSKSALDKVAKSPRHYWDAYINPNRVRAKPTAAMINGTMVHCATLEPEEFDARYIVQPDGIDRRTKEGKAAFAEFEMLAAGKEIITQEQKSIAFAQAKAVRELPDIASALQSGHAEVSAFWMDDETGLMCQCRPDWVHDCGDAGVVLIDVKTTVDASAKGFAKSCANYAYHRQAAWYSDGFEKSSGRKVLAFVFAAVENTAPHVAAPYILDASSIQQGRLENRALLNTLAHCMKTNDFPGYETGIQTISLPAYAFQPV